MLEEEKNLVQVATIADCIRMNVRKSNIHSALHVIGIVQFRLSFDSNMHSSFILPTPNAQLKRMIKCDKIRRNECFGEFDMKQNASVLCYTQTRPCLLWMWDVRS